MEKDKVVFESAHFRKDKSIMPIEVNACLIGHGGKNFILSAARDITEYKRADSALHKSEEELKKKFKELEEFYNMAVGRELRMKELKEEINEMKEELKRYKNPSNVSLRLEYPFQDGFFWLLFSFMRKLSTEMKWSGIFFSRLRKMNLFFM